MSAQNLEVIEPQETVPTLNSAITPMQMLDRAIASGAGLEVVEKLMDLQERWEGSNARKAYDRAIAEAKSKIKPITKDAEVNYTNKSDERTHYKYETLDSIAKAIDPILSEHGLSYRFRSQQSGPTLAVTCIVAHRDGYFEETTLAGPPDQSGKKNTYQAIGSAATYLQRYTLKLALGLSASKDDDAQSAAERPDQGNQGRPQKTVSKDTEARTVFMLHQSSIRQAESRDDLREAWRLATADKDRIPVDWQRDLRAEVDSKLKDITAAEQQANAEEDSHGDFPFGENPPSPSNPDAPINPEDFLKDLEADMEMAIDEDAVIAVWHARTPEDALEFPPDLEKARQIYDCYRAKFSGGR